MARRRRPAIWALLLLVLAAAARGLPAGAAALPERFMAVAPRFPVATRSLRARLAVPAAFAVDYRSRERVPGVQPWCIRVRSEQDYSEPEPGESDLLRCLPSFSIIGVENVRLEHGRGQHENPSKVEGWAQRGSPQLCLSCQPRCLKLQFGATCSHRSVGREGRHDGMRGR